MTDKKLTDEELKDTTGGVKGTISSSQTENRGTYGTGQVEQSDEGGETEPNPLRDSQLGEIRGGVKGTVSAQQAPERRSLTEETGSEATASDRTQPRTDG
jgi:hypothetical protein